tara:strand:- start:351 stop:557 length:207 start_codon:yes stop_codon:yes gene_type:complete
MKYRKLKQGKIYGDMINKEKVEFGYMGQTGLAICYEPGDSGGGMQSSFALRPENLEEITERNIDLYQK